ncbi:MAG: RNA polymerase sigma-70 factor [Chloroflexota bacterium]
MTANPTEQFESYRPLMISIAYRMLGSMTEAEDIVQEAYLRYRTQLPQQINSHKAFLSTVVTRLCLNRLQSAQAQRETYIGPWLPEPVLTDDNEQFAPAKQAELHDSISIAFLTLLEQLTPLERAVLLLREVFDYDYAEISEVVGKEEAACRQIFSRAKKHIAERHQRFKATPESHRQIINNFIQAVTGGDLAPLMQSLAEDAVAWADGGGKVRGAAIHPIYGREAIARFMRRRFLEDENRVDGHPYDVEVAEVNGELGVILSAEGRVFLVLAIGIDENLICDLRIIGNPDKLKWLNKDYDSNKGTSQ